MLCGARTDHADAEMKDMVDVTCPECRVRTRLVATPMCVDDDDE
jgi:hypothetical protein